MKPDFYQQPLNVSVASAQSLVSVMWEFCAFEMQTHTVPWPHLYYDYWENNFHVKKIIIIQAAITFSFKVYGKEVVVNSRCFVCSWIDAVDRPGHCRLDEGSMNRCMNVWCQVMGKGGTVRGHLVDGWKMKWQGQTDKLILFLFKSQALLQLTDNGYYTILQCWFLMKGGAQKFFKSKY